MLFRVILSSDVDEYYKVNSTDVRVTLSVDADSFKKAELIANQHMETIVFWAGAFEVVSIEHVGASERDIYDEIEVPTPKLDKLLSEPTVFDEPVKKAPEIWCLDTGIRIADPDGWDRRNYEVSWYEPITRDDFLKRAYMSTCYEWPNPLLDDDTQFCANCDLKLGSLREGRCQHCGTLDW